LLKSTASKKNCRFLLTGDFNTGVKKRRQLAIIKESGLIDHTDSPRLKALTKEHSMNFKGTDTGDKIDYIFIL
jgi:endonuclease/exonuclease/phosphatase family metal-dependent hydrolase